jgi:C4-dicarboxylate-specific signal transduction histidine kinase
LRLLPTDRPPVEAAVTVAPVRNRDNLVIGLRWLLQDITERKRATDVVKQHEADLAHVSRLSVMGEMATGLAHELNQPLAAILNYVQGCVRRLQAGGCEPGQLLQALEEVAAQAHRAGAIITRLRAFVSKRPFQRGPVMINDVVREVLGLAAPGISSAAPRIWLDLDDALPPVYVDRIQIEQVLLNLVRNGVEAMADVLPAERELTISTSLPSDGTVQVAVRDTGTGLSAEHRERLFEPFFTTKPQGMGMGLAISRSILEAHGQKLWATANGDRGTTFCFTLPVSDGVS